jgi:hypothetical protein
MDWSMEAEGSYQLLSPTDPIPALPETLQFLTVRLAQFESS